MAPHHIRLALGLGVSVLALAMSGCAGGLETTTSSAAEPNETQSQKSRPHNPRSRTATPHPTTSPSTTQSPVPVAAASGSPSGRSSAAPRRPADRLLTVAEMPGLPDGVTWRELSTRRSEGKEPFGTCHKFAMTSIGAMSVVVREYAHGRGAEQRTAGHLVADFADERTARRGLEVLKAWRGQCEEELADYDQRDVGALQVLSDAGDDAGWYLLSYGPRPGGAAGEGYYDAQGLTRVGRRIAVVEFRDAPGYDNPRDEEPIVEAVRSASAKLS